MKIFETEIYINEQDQWWNGSNEIKNSGVVKFFKMNLHRDPKYFIHLKYRDKEEKGYLKKVEGFPLLTETLEESSQIIFQLDNEQKTILKELFFDSIKNYYWSIWEDKEYNNFIPYKINFRILQSLSPYITEDVQNNYYLFYKNNKIPIIEKNYNPKEFS